jgi:hypothetical protein
MEAANASAQTARVVIHRLDVRFFIEDVVSLGVDTFVVAQLRLMAAVHLPTCDEGVSPIIEELLRSHDRLAVFASAVVAHFRRPTT